MSERERGIERVKGVVLAALLMSAWAATLVNYRLGIQLWKDFKIEMPASTVWGVLGSEWPISGIGFLMLLCVAILTSLRERWAWVLALVPLVLLVMVNLSALLPVIAITNQLGGPQLVSPISAVVMPLLASAWTLFVIAVFAWALLHRTESRVI